ncbi:MAG: diaminopimelate decarboxylase [Candidatus Riflebacteria bacterium]|nr:diaminopimelate decarboxylase [Candidatus Riflebacteria bacterium]
MIDFANLASEFGTPLYVYDATEVRRRIHLARAVFEGLDAHIFFAVKANTNPALLSLIKMEGVGADVVGPGELEAAVRAQIRDLLLNGNGKTPAIAGAFVDAGGSYVSMDTPDELSLWHDFPVKRLLRVNPNIVAGGHKHIATGGNVHKFGVAPERIPEAIGYLDGLHVHIGSQILDPEPFREAYTAGVNLAQSYKLKLLDIGGGWGIRYGHDERDLDLDEFRERVVLPVLRPFDGTLLVELGRWIIASAGSLLLQVISVKKSGKTFVVVDAGMNALIRPALYDAWHDVEPIRPRGPRCLCDVVGPVCETGDVLAHDRELALPDPGDILRIANTGAYGFSMASNYNGTMRPAEVLVDGANTTLIRRRETLDDFFATCSTQFRTSHATQRNDSDSHSSGEPHESN